MLRDSQTPGQIPRTCVGNHHVVLDTNAPAAPQPAYQLAVQVLPQLPFQQGIHQGRNKIETRFDGDHHTGFQPAGEAEKRRVFRRRRWFTSHIVNLYAQEMTDAMGNPFQMLAATHGSRIIEHFFPPKIEPIPQTRGHDDLSAELPSPATWQDAEQNLNAEEVEAEELN